MQTTYFASFLLRERAAEVPPSFTEALEVIEDWIFKNPRRILPKPKDWLVNDDGHFEFRGGEKIEIKKLYAEQNLSAVGIRFEHPGANSTVWKADTILHLEDAASFRFSTTVSAGNIEEAVAPVLALASRPRVIPTMMRRFGARGTLPLKPTFINIESYQAETFISQLLLNKQRSLPVTFISRINEDSSLPCNVEDVAEKLAGISYTCVANSVDVSWAMSELMDNKLNTYDGAIRIYWPNMSFGDSPFRHKLWTKIGIERHQTRGRSISDEILSVVSEASIGRQIKGITRWEDLERAIVGESLRELRINSSANKARQEDFEAWLKIYESDLEALNDTRAKLEAANSELSAAHEELQSWKRLYLHSLRQQRVGGEITENEGNIEIENAEEAIDLAKKEFADHLEFIDGRIEKEAYQFGRPELLYAALQWLNQTYWGAKTAQVRCEDLDKSCRESCDFSYSAHQSRTTMGMFESDYKINYEGKNIFLEKHIGYGSNPAPHLSIRLAFFFDQTKRKVVIGYIGQHQTTRRSN